jgi:hypothetical protein
MMKRVLFVQASESPGPAPVVLRLRNNLPSHVQIVQPPPDCVDGKTTLNWLAKTKTTIHHVVVWFANAHLPDGRTEPAAGGGGVPVVTSAERNALLSGTTIAVAIGSASGTDPIPPDLRQFRLYDVSTNDGYEALLCSLVHKPVRRDADDEAPSGIEAGRGAFQMMTSVALTIVGYWDKTRDLLVATFANYAQYVHYLIAVAVVGLFLTGLVSFAWPLVVSVLRKNNPTGSPGTLGRLKLTGAAALVSVTLGAFVLPDVPTVEAVARQHTLEWADRLLESQTASGGFREHHDRGHVQAWTTAQAITALAMSRKTIDAGVYDRAVAFLERTRIGPYAVDPDAKVALAESVRGVVKQAIDPSTLPDRVPSTAFQYDLLALFGRETELPRTTVEALDARQTALFNGSPGNEGWGYFAQFDWGVTEIAAWVGIAAAQVLRAEGRVGLRPDVSARARELLRQAATLVRARQITGIGGFSPILDASTERYARTYPTILAVWVLSEAASTKLAVLSPDEREVANQAIDEGVRWLAHTAQSNGWYANPDNRADPPFPGLAAQALCILDRLERKPDQTSAAAFSTVRATILQSIDAQRDMERSDRLHDSDRYLFPTTRVTEGSTFLWYPWVVALTGSPANGVPETPAAAKSRSNINDKLRARAGEYDAYLDRQYNYVAAESLIGFSWTLK